MALCLQEMRHKFIILLPFFNMSVGRNLPSKINESFASFHNNCVMLGFYHQFTQKKRFLFIPMTDLSVCLPQRAGRVKAAVQLTCVWRYDEIVGADVAGSVMPQFPLRVTANTLTMLNSLNDVSSRKQRNWALPRNPVGPDKRSFLCLYTEFQGFSHISKQPWSSCWSP